MMMTMAHATHYSHATQGWRTSLHPRVLSLSLSPVLAPQHTQIPQQHTLFVTHPSDSTQACEMRSHSTPQQFIASSGTHARASHTVNKDRTPPPRHKPSGQAS